MAENIQQAVQLATTDAQLVILSKFSNDSAHFINALSSEVLKWYNATPLLNIDDLIRDIVKT
jgi:hypothetical protein